ncbi:MAG: hypothetical protein HN886_00010 [Woeseiaceae bacterium]|jgi:dTDP-4-amino-4,6-dideoxygalactose transaminase|nr:hypothetical protein [Woeseiaceae bacterium]
MMKLIEPEIPEMSEYLDYLKQSYNDQQFSNFGPNVIALEKEIEHYTSLNRSACLVSSATSGLSATLLSLNVKGKVAIPAFTFMATAAAVINAGCIPFAVDCDLDTLEMCPIELRKILESEQINAVIHVRSFGFCRDLRETEQLVKTNEIPLIIDAAASFGGKTVNNEIVGYAGTAEVFSLHATKPFAVGEGGLVLAEKELILKIKSIINFNIGSEDMSKNWGMNAKMSEFHAAVGRAALDKLDTVLLRRRKMAEIWHDELRSLKGYLEVPDSIGYPSWQLFPVKLKKPLAHKIQSILLNQNLVQTKVYYYPTINFHLPDNTSTPKSALLSHSILCFPIGKSVNKETIVNCINKLELILQDEF